MPLLLLSNPEGASGGGAATAAATMPTSPTTAAYLTGSLRSRHRASPYGILLLLWSMPLSPAAQTPAPARCRAPHPRYRDLRN